MSVEQQREQLKEGQARQDVGVDVGHGHGHPVVPDTEAEDLRELHRSATILTPYSVAPTEDNDVWLSSNQQTYTDHMKQGAGGVGSHIVRYACILVF